MLVAKHYFYGLVWHMWSPSLRTMKRGHLFYKDMLNSCIFCLGGVWIRGVPLDVVKKWSLSFPTAGSSGSGGG